MLVLDCSSSLAGDFEKAQSNANDFINTLYSAVSESGGNSNDDTVYSTKPIDLSVAIFKNGTRYYLTTEQLKKANLNDATVEGLVVLSKLGDFIISPSELNWEGNITAANAMRYYSDLLPDKDQASIVSARYPEIHYALVELGWTGLWWGTQPYYNDYLTKTDYDSNGNKYIISLRNYTGGNLGAGNYAYIRGFLPIDTEGPIIWKDERDLTLAVKKDGKRYFISDANEDLSAYDEVEGVAVFFGGEKFIIKLYSEQSNTLTQEMAVTFYEDLLPTYAQARIISLNRNQINSALTKFGGTNFSIYVSYLVGDKYDDARHYYLYFKDSDNYNQYGSISYGSGQVIVRGVIPIED